jgi:type II secretory pathway pseudopilin PulG
MKKIQSFTMVELIVGMIISSIVLGISFYTLIIFNTENKKFNKRSNSLNSFLLFRKVISGDFQNASDILASGDRIRLYQANLAEPIINYLVDTGKIIRFAASGTDTFYLNNRMAGLKMVSPVSETVQRIQWKVFLNYEIIDFTLNKDYSSANLMEAEKRETNEQY